MSQYARNLETYLVGAMNPGEKVEFTGRDHTDQDGFEWLEFTYRNETAWACVNEIGEVEIEEASPVDHCPEIEGWTCLTEPAPDWLQAGILGFIALFLILKYCLILKYWFLR